MKRFQLCSAIMFLIGFAFMAGGCGDGRPARVPVSGQVLYDGKPLTVGFVRVIPADGRAATGELDSQGRFVLSTYEKNDGCLIGTHPVEVLSFDNSHEDISIPLIPTKYNKRKTSGLSVTIEGPTDDVILNLSSQAR